MHKASPDVEHIRYLVYDVGVYRAKMALMQTKPERNYTSVTRHVTEHMIILLLFLYHSRHLHMRSCLH